MGSQEANIISVKVLTSSGSGSGAGIIAAIDWVATQSDKWKSINMSLGTSSVYLPV
jgi:subtilisin family serine protease